MPALHAMNPINGAGNLATSSTSTTPNPQDAHAAAYGQSPTAQATAAAALSQDTSPTPTTSGRKPKMAHTPGSRSVAKLTTEQLAKKRANDREAQRAIRERTRNQIQKLEARIRELESQQPFQELQRVVAERDGALQECADLRALLNQVAAIVGTGHPRLSGELYARGYQQHLSLRRDAELAALTAQQAPLPAVTQALHHHHTQYPTSASAGAAPYEQQPQLHPDLRSPLSGHEARTSNNAPTPGSIYASSDGHTQRWSPRDHANNSYPDNQQSANLAPLQQTAQNRGPHGQNQSNGERLGVNFLLDGTQQNQSTTAMPPNPYSGPQAQMQALHARLPKNSPPSCPLDSLLTDFIASRRQQLAAGASMRDVLGPEDPDFLSLHDPNAVDPQNRHPVSAVLIDILSKFPDIATLPEKVAVLHIMFLIMRWLICPCEGCYERLPEWIRPTQEQLESPHPLWVDNLPWSVQHHSPFSLSQAC